MKKQVNKIISIAWFLLSLTSLNGFADELNNSNNENIYEVSIFMGENISQRGFTWTSTLSKGKIAYWSNEKDKKSVDAVTKEKALINGRYYNQVMITDLEPGTKYNYQISNTDGTNTEFLDSYFFVANPKDGFNFVYTSDTQIGKNGLVEPVAEAWWKTLEHTFNAFDDLSFILSPGDQIENPDVEYQYYLYLKPELFKHIPMANTVGSHDKHAIYLEHFNLPPNLTAIGKSPTGGNYWFSYGNTLFVSLDTNDRKEADLDHHISYMHKALEEYKTKNNGNEPRWKILNFHYGPYGSSFHTHDNDIRLIRAKLTPVISELDFDLVFNGHDHNHTRSLMMAGIGNANGGTIIDGTAGSKPIRTGYTKKGENHFAEFKKEKNQTFYFIGNTSSLGFNPVVDTDFNFSAYREYSEIPSISIVSINNDRIELNSYYSDKPITEASKFDSFTLKK